MKFDSVAPSASDLVALQPLSAKMSSSTATSMSKDGPVYCNCGNVLAMRTSWTVDNPGRRFYGCKDWKVSSSFIIIWS